MEADIFLETSFGKAAMKKIGPVGEGFMLYEAGWLGDNPRQRDVMEVKGAIFRVAKTGPNKGKRTVMVKDSRVTVYVTAAEMDSIKTER